MIASGTIPVTRLDRVFRFAEGGEISAAAKAINKGAVSSLLSCEEQTEFVFIPCADPETGKLLLSNLRRIRCPARQKKVIMVGDPAALNRASLNLRASNGYQNSQNF